MPFLCAYLVLPYIISHIRTILNNMYVAFYVQYALILPHVRTMTIFYHLHIFPVPLHLAIY